MIVCASGSWLHLVVPVQGKQNGVLCFPYSMCSAGQGTDHPAFLGLRQAGLLLWCFPHLCLALALHAVSQPTDHFQ